MKGSMNEEWKKRGGKETGFGSTEEVVNEQVCTGSETRWGMRIFIRTHLCEQEERGKERLKIQLWQKSMHTSVVHQCLLPSPKKNSSSNPNFVLFSAVRTCTSTVFKETVWKAVTE